MKRERKRLSRDTTEQAAEAWELFHGAEEQASAAEHREFGEWMRRSPEHVESYLRVSRTMQTLRLPSIRWPDTSAETLIQESRAYTGNPVATLPVDSPTESGERRPRIARAPWAFALAAMVLAVIGVAWFMVTGTQAFATRFGEQRFVRLDDGSGVTLNTASRIEVKLSKGHRVIRLVQGEALFDVAHDRARPFDVYTGKTILRAVGTRFDVDVRPSRTTVTVIEGVVSLTHGAGEATPLGNTPLLRAADRVVIDSSGPRTPEHGVRLNEATAWTQQRLIFKGRPLSEVVEEINRYNRERIVIESPQLQAQQISGSFKVNDPASFLDFLANLPGVRVRDAGNAGHVVTLDTSPESGP